MGELPSPAGQMNGCRMCTRAGDGRPKGGGGGQGGRAPWGHTDRALAARWFMRQRRHTIPQDLQSRGKAKKAGAGKGNSGPHAVYAAWVLHRLMRLWKVAFTRTFVAVRIVRLAD